MKLLFAFILLGSMLFALILFSGCVLPGGSEDNATIMIKGEISCMGYKPWSLLYERCISWYAVKKNSEYVCDNATFDTMLPNASKIVCIASVRKDPDSCVAQLGGAFVYYCHNGVAKYNNDIKFCEGLQPPEEIGVCTGAVAYFNQTKEVCLAIADQEVIDSCYNSYAYWSADNQTCELIKNASMKDDCLSYYSKFFSGGPNIIPLPGGETCDSIQTDSTREICKMFFPGY